MAEKNTIIFTIGRMNPPTPGHMELIKTMMEANLELPADDLGHGRVYIILSHSQNNIKDPLSCDQKRGLLLTQGMIGELQRNYPPLATINVTILCTKDVDSYSAECGDRFIISQLCRIIKIETAEGQQPTNMEIILGSDRQGAFDMFVAPYLLAKGIMFNELNEAGNRIFQQYDLKLGRTELTDADEKALIAEYIANPEQEIPIKDMSGSLMRAIVKNGQRDRFTYLYKQLGLSEEDAEALYEQLEYQLKSVVISSKKSKTKGGRKSRGHTKKHLKKRTKKYRKNTRTRKYRKNKHTRK